MKSITRFLKRKRKRILYFLVGMFFSLFTIMNSFIIAKASTDNFQPYQDFYGSFSLDGKNKDGCFINLEKDVTLPKDLWFMESKFLIYDKKFIYDTASWNSIFIEPNGGSPIFYDVEQSDSSLSNICYVTWNDNVHYDEPRSYFFICSKSNFKLFSHSGDKDGTVSDNVEELDPYYDESSHLYYYNFFFYSNAYAMSNLYFVEKQDNENWTQAALSYLNDNDTSNVLNKDFVDPVYEAVNDEYFANSEYYNSYLKGFNCSFLPTVPKFSYLTSLNDLLDRYWRVSYQLNSVQSSGKANYWINEVSTYDLTFSFYKYSDALINAVPNVTGGEKLVRYNNCINQFVSTLSKYRNISVSVSEQTALYVKYTCSVHLSTKFTSPVNSANHYDRYFSYIIRDNNFNQAFNFLRNNTMGVYSSSGSLYSGVGTSSDIKSTNALNIFDTALNVSYINLTGSAQNLSVEDLTSVNKLMGKCFINNHSLNLNFTVNDNSKNYNVTYDFLDSDKTPVIDNKGIDEKPKKDDTISNDNPIAQNDSNSETVTNTQPGNGSGNGTGYGNITQTVTVNQNSKNSVDGLSWADRPVQSEASLGQATNTGYEALGNLTSANGFIQVIASYFSFIPQQFWNVILAVISFVGVIVLFKIVLWII